MFYTTDNQLVNLEHVSSISLDEKNSRIIFNLDYSIQIKSENHFKNISDYIYWNVAPDQYKKEVVNLKNELMKHKNFIEKPSGIGFINLDKVSSVKFDEPRLRIIFNLSNSISFKDVNSNKFKLTAEFIYCDFDNKDAYLSAKKDVENTCNRV